MDGRTRYNKISKLLEPVVGKTLPMDKLKRRVMIDIGSSDEVVRDCIRLMIDLGLVVETKAFVFKVVRSKADI